MKSNDYGIMSGVASGPLPGPAGTLSHFADKLAMYAAGEESEDEFEVDLNDAEEIIMVPNRR